VTSEHLDVQRMGLPPPGSKRWSVLLALNEQSRRPSPFFTPEYMQTYLAHNETYAREEMEPFFLLVRRRASGEVIGALPLKRVWERFRHVPFRHIEFLVSSEVDLPGILARPEDELPAARAAMRGLARSLYAASSVVLIDQPETSALYQAMAEARAPWADVRDSAGMPISTICMTYPDPSAYFHSLSHKMRSNVSRLARRLFAEGPIEYLTSSEPAVLPDLFTLYLDVESRSWKHDTEASLRRNPARIELYQEALRGSGPVRYHVDVLLLSGVAIAAQISMHYCDRTFAMETCYDGRFEDLGPGNLMLFLAISRSIRLGVVEMSLHGHFDYYKHRWLGQSLATRDIRILRRGSVPHAGALVGEALRRMRGQSERPIGIPAGHREHAAQGLRSPRPPSPHAIERAAKLGAHPLVVRSDAAALRALLPFATSAH
jgi:CelD/BcsL family acetyltransferase involved in cellulose biosynthesis